MAQDFWFNLPVKDVKKATHFFVEIGFKLNEQFTNSDAAASFFIGNKNVVMMLFSSDTFKTFLQHSVTDTTSSNEVLFNIDAENPEKANELAELIKKTGGTIVSEPAWHQGWMYGFTFCDLDGHRWNVLHMDMSKLSN